MKNLLMIGCVALVTASAASANSHGTQAGAIHPLVKAEAKAEEAAKQGNKVYVSQKDGKRRRVIKRRGFWSLGGFR